MEETGRQKGTPAWRAAAVMLVLSVHRSAVSRPSDSSALKSRVRGEERAGWRAGRREGVRPRPTRALVYVLLHIHDLHPSREGRERCPVVGWLEDDASATENPFLNLSSPAWTGE